MKSKNNSVVVAGMFASAAAVMILTQLTSVVASIIDGVTASRFIGPNEYSAISLFSSYSHTVSLFASFAATGCQIVCSHFMGQGRKIEAQSIFAVTLQFGIVISAIFFVLCSVLPEPVFSILGVSKGTHPELYPHMLAYSKGYMFGIPALVLVQIIGPLMVLDNRKKLFTFSAIVLCVTDIVGDLLNVSVFHGGTFGMGFATSVSYMAQLCVVAVYFLRKSSYFRFSHDSLKGVVHYSHMLEVFKEGSPAFVRKLATTLRDFFLNRFNLVVALSVAAVAARGMQNDLNVLLFCIGLGIGKTTVGMTGIYYGADDAKGLKSVFAFSMKFSAALSGTVAVVVFFVAPLIARGYTDDSEVISLAVFSMRCMAVALIPDTLEVVFQSYLQGIKNRRLVNFMNFSDRFFIPILSALFLGLFFGSKGIFVSIAAGKILLFVVMFIAVCIHNRRIPLGWKDFMFLPEGFGGKETDNLYEHLYSVEDVIEARDRTFEFCKSHGIDGKKSLYISLFLEEMAVGTITHGESNTNDKVSVDYRLFISGEKICITLRDYCKRFDPKAYYQTHKDEKSERAVGIRMVMKLASSVKYFNAFGSNSVLILV